MPSGPTGRYVHELDREHAQWRGQQPCVTYCLFCGQRIAQGTVLETKLAAETHRQKNHPLAKRKRRRSSRIWPNRRAQRDPFLTDQEDAEIQAERLKRARLNGIEQDLV